MRKAKVHYKGEEAGLVTQHDDGSFTFSYHDQWWDDTRKPSISMSMPKAQQTYQSGELFPFFYHLLPEGANKYSVCRQLRIDENDHFGLLLSVAGNDTIGAVTVTPIHENL